HALACDQCKQNECRPGDDVFVPKALAFVRAHPNPDVRAGAVDALGRVVDRRPDVADALIAAGKSDPNAGVRNMARQRTRHLPMR
ncbi:MAG: HEAT repeat domain-containing protein, partial [Actinobacteria bacterium]|nr:HEAT repeat domain-containing protein [Actinomycetota bacterium]